MPSGRNPSYNPRTGTRTRPKPWYEHKKSGRKKKTGCLGCAGCMIPTVLGTVVLFAFIIGMIILL